MGSLTDSTRIYGNRAVIQPRATCVEHSEPTFSCILLPHFPNPSRYCPRSTGIFLAFDVRSSESGARFLELRTSNSKLQPSPLAAPMLYFCQ